MVEFPLFASRNFVGANMVALIVTFAMLAQFFFLALYMQNILGLLAARGRGPVPAGDPDDRRDRAARRPAHRPDRAALADRRRPDPRDRGAVLADHDRRVARPTATCCPPSS